MSKSQRNTERKRGRRTSDAVEILDAMIGEDQELRGLADQAFEDAVVGQLIYNARAEAGLTQKQLADLIETDQRVISRLEDANYEGHSLSMLRRIANALGKKLEIRFVDQEPHAA